MLENIFEGVEGLPEGFQAKAATVFEAAVNEAVEIQVVERVLALDEKFEISLKEAVEAKTAELEATVEAALSTGIMEWAKSNAVPLGDSLKVRIAESVIADFNRVLVGKGAILEAAGTSHVVASMQKQIDEAHAATAELTTKLNEATIASTAIAKAKLITEATADLSDMQAARVEKLVESVGYTSLGDLSKKVAAIVEAVSGGKKAIKEDDDNEDDKESDKEDEKSDKKDAKKENPFAKKDDKDDKKIDESVVDGVDVKVVDVSNLKPKRMTLDEAMAARYAK